MKKLLVLLGSSFIGVAPVASVIACQDTSKNESNNDNGKILDTQNPWLKLDSEKLLDIILKNGEDKLITNGNPKQTLQNFMSHFAFGLEKNIDFLVKETPDITSNYENDNFVNNVKELYRNLNQKAENAWTDYLEQKRKEHDKNDSKVLEDLQKEYDRKYNNINDFKDDFIYRYAVQGAGNTALRDILNLIVEDFAKSTGFLNAGRAIDEISTLFRGKPTFKEFVVDFGGTAFKASGPDDDRANTWFGQFDNYLKGLRALSLDTDQTLFKESAASLINLVNATGGLELEEYLTKNPDKTTILVDDIQWLTFNNIKTTILVSDDATITTWSNKLLKRMDTNYDEHFNSNNLRSKNEAIDGLVSNLSANGEIAKLNQTYRSLFENIPNINNDEPTSDQLTGLFSNSQRYFADLYFKQKKPVAITEFVVKPWVTGSDVTEFSKEVTNSPYINKTTLKYRGLYNFINIFVNSSISKGAATDNADDHTKKMFDNESNYSWDVLLQNGGSLDGIKHNGNQNNQGSWTPSSQLWEGIGSELSQVDHTNLLTIDSKDYSDTLKYAVYDFLQKDKSAISEWNSWDKDGRTGYKKDYNITDLEQADQPIGTAISSLIHSLDRSAQLDATAAQKTENNVYQVLNAEQGIIAFTADDGIHFARIEGYKLIQSAADTSSDYLKEQSKLTISKDDDIKKYETYHQLNTALNSKEAVTIRAAEQITSDYLNVDISSQERSKIKYADLNSNFGNKYLEFLANTSILANIVEASQTKYKYNFQREVQNWLSTSATTSDKYWIPVWDYIKEIFNITDDEKLFDAFFNVAETSDDKTKNLAKEYKRIILETLNSSRKLIFANSKSKFVKDWNNYASLAEAKIGNPKDDGIHYRPWNYLKMGTGTTNNYDKIIKIENSSIWKYEKQQTTVILKFSIDFNKYLTKTNLIEITNNNKAILKESSR